MSERAAELRLGELKSFLPDVDEALHRCFAFTVEEVRDSGAGGGIYTVKGHAAVFDKWSLDLGGFRERVAKGAFDNVLSRDPHVLHTWDHDTAKSLSSTRSKTYPLELRTDPAGLRFYSKVAPTTYSADLRVLLDGGVVDQSSFAFTVERDEWVITENANGDSQVERTILEVRELFDVTTCAMGAYPTTDSVLAVRSVLAGRSKSTVAIPVAVAATSTTSTTTEPLAGVARVLLQSAETRADTDGVALLSQMYQLGQDFLETEADPDETSDRDAMSRILEQLEALMESEAAEDPAGTRGRRDSGASTNDDGGAAPTVGAPEPEPQEPLGDGTERSDEDRARELADLKAEVADATRRTRERVFNIEPQESET